MTPLGRGWHPGHQLDLDFARLRNGGPGAVGGVADDLLDRLLAQLPGLRNQRLYLGSVRFPGHGDRHRRDDAACTLGSNPGPPPP